MLKCACCVEKLSEYIDETLGARQATRLRAHLKRCSACGAEYETLLAVREALRTAQTPLVRPGFWRQAELALRTHADPRVRRMPALPALRGWAFGAASVLLAWGGIARFAPVPAPERPLAKAGVTRIAAGAEGPISLDALISLHARQSAKHPLSDAGRLRYLGSSAEQADLQYDGKLDIR